LTVVAQTLIKTSSSLGYRPCNVVEPQDLRWPVPVEDNRSHQLPIPLPVEIATLYAAPHRKCQTSQQPWAVSFLVSYIYVHLRSSAYTVAS
jgi:hypothetical protein